MASHVQNRLIGAAAMPGNADEGCAARRSGSGTAASRPVWERRGLGSQASVVMVGQVSGEDRERARSLGLDLTPLSLQQLVVRASAGPADAGS